MQLQDRLCAETAGLSIAPDSAGVSILEVNSYGPDVEEPSTSLRILDMKEQTEMVKQIVESFIEGIILRVDAEIIEHQETETLLIHAAVWDPEPEKHAGAPGEMASGPAFRTMIWTATRETFSYQEHGRYGSRWAEPVKNVADHELDMPQESDVDTYVTASGTTAELKAHFMRKIMWWMTESQSNHIMVSAATAFVRKG